MVNFATIKPFSSLDTLNEMQSFRCNHLKMQFGGLDNNSNFD